MDNKQYAWAWKADSQDYSFSHDSIDECLEEARAENDENYKKVYIGIAEEKNGKINMDIVHHFLKLKTPKPIIFKRR